jgi:hypothetical protein
MPQILIRTLQTAAVVNFPRKGIQETAAHPRIHPPRLHDGQEKSARSYRPQGELACSIPKSHPVINPAGHTYDDVKPPSNSLAGRLEHTPHHQGRDRRKHESAERMKRTTLNRREERRGREGGGKSFLPRQLNPTNSHIPSHPSNIPNPNSPKRGRKPGRKGDEPTGLSPSTNPPSPPTNHDTHTHSPSQTGTTL